MPTQDELDAAVDAERARCVAIVQAARFGEIDGDFRSIISRIERGEAFPYPAEAEAEAGK